MHATVSNRLQAVLAGAARLSASFHFVLHRRDFGQESKTAQEKLHPEVVR